MIWQLVNVIVGKILIDWKAQLEYPNDKLRTWSGSDPCFNTNPWDQVSCDPDGFVIRMWGYTLDILLSNICTLIFLKYLCKTYLC